MKPNSTYHFRVVAKSGGTSYVSDDDTIDTGAPPSGLPVQNFNVEDAGSHERGFIIFTLWQGQGTQSAYVLDADGDPVWWNNAGINGMGRAIMSADGKNMWMITASNAGGGAPPRQHGWSRLRDVQCRRRVP
jgi:hypothetical protein